MPAVLGLCLIYAFTKIAFAWLSNEILSFDFFITEIKKQCKSNFRNRIDVCRVADFTAVFQIA